MTLHARLARIARDELKNAYASREDAAEAMAAAIINELEMVEECPTTGNPDDYQYHWDHRHRYSTPWRPVA